MKVAVIGSSGFATRHLNYRVDCFAWEDLVNLDSLSDYDRLVVSVLDGKPSVPADDLEVLSPQTARDILMSDGDVIILGDPRFFLTYRDSNSYRDFLGWTTLDFVWDGRSGDTLTKGPGAAREFDSYMEAVSKWDYSLERASVSEYGIRALLSAEADSVLRSREFRYGLQSGLIAQNRYGFGVASYHRVAIEQATRSGYGVIQWSSIATTGRVILLPAGDRTADEAIATILRDSCGVEVEAPTPAWVAEFQVPGEAEILEAMARESDEIAAHQARRAALANDREEARGPLGVLFQMGPALEAAVIRVLEDLGATVEVPQSPGQEDGWVSVEVEGEVLQGVLEIKGTRKETFGESGLKQVIEWRTRGVDLRSTKYRAIFIGANSITEHPASRQDGFSDGWRKKCELHEISALNTTALFEAWVLHKEGRLDLGAFWRAVFSSDGVVEIDSAIGRTSGDDNVR